VKRQNIFEGRTKNFSLICDPQIYYDLTYYELEQWTTGGTTKRTSVQPLKKPTANGNTNSRAGIAELKTHSKDLEKIPPKTRMFIISPIFFSFVAEKMPSVIDQQRSIFKIQNHPNI
jgi:hypothetical protein